MKKHVKIYCDYFGIGEQDVLFCEHCGKGGKSGFNIHHIKYKSRGGTDDIENLMCLCVKCHDMAHKELLTESDLLLIHRTKMMQYG